MDVQHLCVSGYVREAQRLLPKGNIYFNVPQSIVIMILAYYRIWERFEKWYTDKVAVEDDGRTAYIFRDCRTAKTVYGKIDIVEHPHAIYRWTFTSIMTTHHSSWMHLGIDSSGCLHCREDYTACGNKHPFYSCGEDLQYSKEKRDEESRAKLNWNVHHEKVIMELNTKTKQMKFVTGDDDEGSVAFEDITFDDDTVYRLAVLMGGTDESITLDSFKLKYL